MRPRSKKPVEKTVEENHPGGRRWNRWTLPSPLFSRFFSPPCFVQFYYKFFSTGPPPAGRDIKHLPVEVFHGSTMFHAIRVDTIRAQDWPSEGALESRLFFHRSRHSSTGPGDLGVKAFPTGPRAVRIDTMQHTADVV